MHHLDNSVTRLLKYDLQDTEIKKVLFDMAAWKSPRLDGFSAGYYQNTRNLTGENIFSLTQQLWHKDASLGNSAYYAQIQE